jgi:hypothetical protein
MKRQRWYQEHYLEPIEAGDHPASRKAEQLLRRTETYRALQKRILERGDALKAVLEPKGALQIWFDLEADLSEKSSALQETHYDLGVDVGLATRAIDDVLANANADPKIAPAAAIHALAQALVRIAERLKDAQA